jgi:hypothetical protein
VVREIAAVLDRVVPGQDRSGSNAGAITGRRLSSRLVVISDFLDDDPTTLRAITGHLAKGGEAHAVRVMAREEVDPPAQSFTAIDPESPRVSRPFGPSVREGYRRRFTEWGTAVAARWRAAGATWCDVISDEPALDAIRRVVGQSR